MKAQATFKWLLVSILIAAAALRFTALGRQSLWDDEGFTLQDAHIIPGQNFYEVQPPLYFVLLRGWTRLAGTSVSAVRAFSAFCGLAGVALLGLAARRMVSPTLLNRLGQAQDLSKLLADEPCLNIASDQGTECGPLARLIWHIETFVSQIADARGEAEPEQMAQG
jgi:hypothetical protein